MLRLSTARRVGAAAAGVLLAALPVIARAAEGMPQLDMSNPLTISQVVWMFLVFIGLYVLMARWGLPRVAEVVDQRTASIAADLETAREAKAKADAAIEELREATRRAHAEAQARIAEAIAEAKRQAAEDARRASEQLDQQLREAEQRIVAARNQAMGALREVARDTTSLLVHRLVGRTPDPQAVDRAVGLALAANEA